MIVLWLVLIFFCESSVNLFAQSRLTEMQKQIELLENQKKKCLKEKKRHLMQAYERQNDSEMLSEVKREYIIAKQLEDRIHVIEKKIKSLEQEIEEEFGM